MHNFELESPAGLRLGQIHADCHSNVLIFDDDPLRTTWQKEQHKSVPCRGCRLRLFWVPSWVHVWFGDNAQGAQSSQPCWQL